MHIYGIKNCDTVKKARKWLEANGIPYTFHDFREEAITGKKLKEWEKQVGWEVLLNRKSTTWRAASPEEQRAVTDADSAIRLMLEKPTLIKRPVIEGPRRVLVGFDEQTYNAELKP